MIIDTYMTSSVGLRIRLRFSHSRVSLSNSPEYISQSISPSPVNDLTLNLMSQEEKL